MNAQLPPRRLTGAIVPALAAAVLAGGATLTWLTMPLWRGAAGASAPTGCATGDLHAIGGPIDLVDSSGHAVTQSDFAGRPAIVYFGYTHCPDACPTTLYALGEALRASNATVQPVFVSIDPDRDTPDVMRAYATTNGFPAHLAALTGSASQVSAAAHAFRVQYRKVPIEGGRLDDYNIDHTSLIYVMDPQWRTRAAMTTVGATPQAISECIQAGLAVGR